MIRRQTMIPRQAASAAGKAAVACLLALAACNFNSPIGAKPSADVRPKLEALPPPADIAEDPVPPPGAPAAPIPQPPAPSDTRGGPGLKEPPADQSALPPPEAPLSEPAGPSIAWTTSLEGNAILVELNDATSHYRVERVELLGPGGVRLPSAPLARTVERSYGYDPAEKPLGPVTLSGSGGPGDRTNIHIGIGGAFPGKNYTAPPKTTTRTRIALADPAAYRSDPNAWKIAVSLLDSEGNPSFVQIPAPAR